MPETTTNSKKSVNDKPKLSEEKINSKPRKTAVLQSEVPRFSLKESLKVARAIVDNFAKSPTKPLRISEALNLSLNSSNFRMLIGASSAYGLTEGSYKSELISLTDIGKKILTSTEDGMELAAMREAFLKPRIIKAFLEKYNNSRVPQEKIARNVLEELGVPSDSTEQSFKLIFEGARELGLLREVKGSFYVDLDTTPELNFSVDEPDAEEIDEENNYSQHLRDAKPTTPEISKPTHTESDSQINNRVFITHGKNLQIVNQLKEILTFGKFQPVAAAEHETVSKPVPDKVLDDMKSCNAAIIHVGKEIKAIDEEGKERIFINQNVLIEIGAAMALYNRRFILLVERGTELPSNLQGLYEVRYEGDRLDYEATMKLLKAFNDFNN